MVLIIEGARRPDVVAWGLNKTTLSLLSTSFPLLLTNFVQVFVERRGQRRQLMNLSAVFLPTQGRRSYRPCHVDDLARRNHLQLPRGGQRNQPNTLLSRSVHVNSYRASRSPGDDSNDWHQQNKGADTAEPGCRECRPLHYFDSRLAAPISERLHNRKAPSFQLLGENERELTQVPFDASRCR